MGYFFQTKAVYREIHLCRYSVTSWTRFVRPHYCPHRSGASCPPRPAGVDVCPGWGARPPPCIRPADLGDISHRTGHGDRRIHRRTVVRVAPGCVGAGGTRGLLPRTERRTCVRGRRGVGGMVRVVGLRRAVAARQVPGTGSLEYWQSWPLTQ